MRGWWRWYWCLFGGLVRTLAVAVAVAVAVALQLFHTGFRLLSGGSESLLEFSPAAGHPGWCYAIWVVKG